VLFDQRGAGKSKPSAEIRNNTSQFLAADIERLREHLGITKWQVVFGGSWGSTLALLYAQLYPSSVGSLVLRGIFLLGKADLAESYDGFPFYIGSARNQFPDAFDDFLQFLPMEERKDPLDSYHKRLISEDESVSLPAAAAWNTWETSHSKLYYDAQLVAQTGDPRWNLNHARIEAHYFVNRAWLEEDQLILEKNISRIRHIPS
jgi:proline iminopeptidase